MLRARAPPDRAPWTADIPFKATDEKIFEFACHEANYSIANALRGARTEEKEGVGRQQ